MCQSISLLAILCFQIASSAQWNTDLNSNLVLSATARIENVLYDGNGYYLTWQEGSGPFSHQVVRLNLDGTYNWPMAMLAHDHDLGSSTLNLQHSAVDNDHNFIRVSSYINDNGEFCCINKIDTTGTQLLNGATGIEFSGLAMGFALGQSGNMYVLVNSDLKKVDANGNVLWTTTLDPDHLNSRAGRIIESANGSVGVAYFVPGGGNPAYGRYYIARFDAAGNRTTVGSVLISPALCSFYRPYFFTANAAGDYYFVCFDTNTSVSFVQHIIGDAPQISGNGIALDNAANSSFITGVVIGNTLCAFYQYDWNSFDEGGMKLQVIDMANGSLAYDQGVNLFNAADGVRPMQHSAVDLNGIPACLIVENPSNVVRLLEYGNAGMNSYPLFTSSSTKGLGATSTFNTINSGGEKQVVAFIEDYRNGTDYPAAVAQNLILDSIISVEHLTQSSINVYPNPTDQSTHLAIDESLLGAQCTIMDATGKMIQSFPMQRIKYEINTAGWPAGIYHVILQKKSVRMSRTLVLD
jgi:hypothetical protein